MATEEQFIAAMNTTYACVVLAESVREASCRATRVGFDPDEKGSRTPGISRDWFAREFSRLGTALDAADEAVGEIDRDLSRLHTNRVVEFGITDHSYHHLCLQWSKLVWVSGAETTPTGQQLLWRFSPTVAVKDESDNQLQPTWAYPKQKAYEFAEALAAGCCTVSTIESDSIVVELEKECDRARIEFDHTNFKESIGDTAKPDEEPRNLTAERNEFMYQERMKGVTRAKIRCMANAKYPETDQLTVDQSVSKGIDAYCRANPNLPKPPKGKPGRRSQ